MKNSKVILSGAILVGSSSAFAGEKMILVKDLPRLGLGHLKIAEIYRENVGINLDPNELLKVTRDEEGQNLSFETLDSQTVVVPFVNARGPVNKDVVD